ncbi:hypothetical protein BaRGS_00029854 [Batillaria attramentaria]|uniref:Sialate O-acetylesterase domain-containing protein n=1 Tax=Batillaria attramentaria TaxID=370345 RepID=A0ABD0JWC0_9CAEN
MVTALWMVTLLGLLAEQGQCILYVGQRILYLGQRVLGAGQCILYVGQRILQVGQCALKLASYYSDHMVLQRGPQRAVIWGTASTEGDTVTVMNSTAEIQAATSFNTIRFMASQYTKSNTPMETLDVAQRWTLPTQQSLADFSAVCFLFAESLQPHLNYPLGLVESSWGGTSIEAWSPPEAIHACPVVTHGQEPYVVNYNVHSGSVSKPSCCPHAPEVLWNSKIYPLLEMTIFGALWYQGETNADHTAEYSCQMEALVREWRKQFNSHSMGETRADFPFGYVQLAGYRDDDSVGGFPALRWSQTANHGYSPNPDLPNTFMAVAMDLPDYTSPYDPIHPRYKQDVAQRLTLGALHVAYGHDDVDFQGPFPSGFATDDAQHTLTIEYDHGHTPLDIRSNDGFEVCCQQNQCGDFNPWTAAPITGHDASHVTVSYAGCGSRHPVGLRYAWRTSPCDLKQCAVYAADSDLPAPPYVTKSL